MMKHKHWWQGGLMTFIGFMLSPLSWWNDAFVNFPLAIGFGWLVALAFEPAFEPAVVFGYWLTNVLGLVLMHKGAQRALRPNCGNPTRANRWSAMSLFHSRTLW
jgi:hypothetical protein